MPEHKPGAATFCPELTKAHGLSLATIRFRIFGRTVRSAPLQELELAQVAKANERHLQQREADQACKLAWDKL